MENLKFVLFYPVSICIGDKYFQYTINEGTFYPCLLGIIKDDNTLVDVISGRKFDIIRKGTFEITDKSKVVCSPVCVYNNISNSLENLKFIEGYINAKGNVCPFEIDEFADFAHRLHQLVSVQYCYAFGKYTGFYKSFRNYKSAKSYLKKIDIENSKSLALFSYIQSGQKDKDELSEKNGIISRLRNRLLK